MLASSASDAPVGGPEGGARPFCASVSSPRNQSSGGWVQNSLVPDSYFFSAFCCCAPAWVMRVFAIAETARMAAHASMDRWKADFIASLPMQPDPAAPVICFERYERRRLVCGWADGNRLAHPRQERSGPRTPC